MFSPLQRSWMAVAMILGLVVSAASCAASETVYPSPDGQREALIKVGSSGPDQVWTIVVKEEGLFGDSTEIGCFTDDDPEAEVPTGIAWASNDEIVISTASGDELTPGAVRVRLNTYGSAENVTQANGDFAVGCPGG